MLDYIDTSNTYIRECTNIRIALHRLHFYEINPLDKLCHMMTTSPVIGSYLSSYYTYTTKEGQFVAKLVFRKQFFKRFKDEKNNSLLFYKPLDEVIKAYYVDGFTNPAFTPFYSADFVYKNSGMLYNIDRLDETSVLLTF